MKTRTRQHYESMLSRNPNTSIGFTLAAQAVYAARHGIFDANAEDHDQDEYRAIATGLKSKYGEVMTVDEVRFEMAQLVCARCGHIWYTRTPKAPRVCSKCKSPYWDRPRRDANNA
jgi:rubrerythrin